MTLIMSVSGVRGLVGRTMTPELARDLGAAFGAHLARGSVVVGRDTRASGPELVLGLIAGLTAAGREVIDLGVVSTPGTALMVGRCSAAGGVVVTASHNPAEWNGIKFLVDPGLAPSAEEADRIFARYRERDFAAVDPGRAGSVHSNETTHDHHVARVSALLDVDAIRRRAFTVVLDSVNGAGGTGGRLLLERLGCRLIHIHAEPHGRFAHAPEPTAEHLGGLCDAVRARGADLGFAQDPDADRLAVVDDTGSYIGEEYTLALAALFVLSRKPGLVAANLSTSRRVDDIAAAAGGGAAVIRTPVGEAHVARAVLDRRCVLGGEGNGGVIDPRVVPVRDSFVAMGLILNLLADRREPLSRIVDGMPRYVMLKRKFELARPKIDAWLSRAADRLDGHKNTADGLRIDRPEGWVHLRPSNTEPIARLIAEARDEPTAAGLIRRVTDLM